MADNLREILYYDSPKNEITFEQFQMYGQKRVQLLHKIDNMIEWSRIQEKKTDIDNGIIHNYTQYGFDNNSFNSLNDENNINIDRNNKDLISHFITKLAYSGQEDKHFWYVNQETRLLKAKIITRKYNNVVHIQNFFKLLNIPFSLINLSDLDKDLQNDMNCLNFEKSEQQQIFKMDFENALPLVSDFKVVLRKGKAYLYPKECIRLITSKYQQKLLGELKRGRRNYQKVTEKDERIMPILKRLTELDFSEYSAQMQQQGNRNKISLPDLDFHAKKHFPACMRTMYDNLKINSHLKHGGRLTFGLFLKGIGLSLEDSIKFWKNEFVKKMPADKFDREHAYGIKHNYGKIGKRVDYNPYGCQKIIQAKLSSDEHHGCPYNYFSIQNLKVLLKRMGVDINGPDFDIIVEKKNEGKYQIACKKVFQILFPRGNFEVVGNHPNIYFDQAMKEGNSLKTPRLSSSKPEQNGKMDIEHNQSALIEQSSIFNVKIKEKRSRKCR